MPFEPRPNSGSLFSREKKSQNHPDMGGYFTMDETLLEYLNDCHSKGEEMKLELSGWRKQGNKGSFLSLSVKKPWDGNQSSGFGTKVSYKAKPKQESPMFDDPLDKMPWDE
jgi:hypothetical protein